MLTIKNRATILQGTPPGSSALAAVLLLVAVVWLAGCTPPGPRAFLEGKRLLDKGDLAQAVEKLKAATSLLDTNALAWNCLGVACHRSGQQAEAEAAYKKALELDRDLMEAHFNLGCLYLEQNRADKLETARAHLLAFTIRRSSAEGFTYLGTVQLRLKDAAGADKSFSEALKLSPGKLEALNGLALARLQRGRTVDTARLLSTALQKQPDYAPALLNAAVLEQSYFRNRASALNFYRRYVAVRPLQEDAPQVLAVIRQLEQQLAPPPPKEAATPPPEPGPGRNPAVSAAPQPSKAETSVTSTSTVASPVAAAKPEAPAKSTSPPRSNSPAATMKSPPAKVAPVETVRVAPQPEIKVAQETSAVVTSPSPRQAPPAAVETTEVASRAETKPPPTRGLLQALNPLNLLRSSERQVDAPAQSTTPSTQSGALRSPAIPRYTYRSPGRPAAGNRAQAEAIFAQAVQEQQQRRYREAQADYRKANQADPAFFRSRFNLAFVNTELGDLEAALVEYEYALAIEPESTDARYNFGLALKQAGYLADAMAEFQKVLEADKSQARAHLALGNLFAQQFQQPAKARAHYLQVLELDPRNPQASAIRYWLSANP